MGMELTEINYSTEYEVLGLNCVQLEDNQRLHQLLIRTCLQTVNLILYPTEHGFQLRIRTLEFECHHMSQYLKFDCNQWSASKSSLPANLVVNLHKIGRGAVSVWSQGAGERNTCCHCSDTRCLDQVTDSDNKLICRYLMHRQQKLVILLLTNSSSPNQAVGFQIWGRYEMDLYYT